MCFFPHNNTTASIECNVKWKLKCKRKHMACLRFDTIKPEMEVYRLLPWQLSDVPELNRFCSLEELQCLFSPWATHSTPLKIKRQSCLLFDWDVVFALTRFFLIGYCVCMAEFATGLFSRSFCLLPVMWPVHGEMYQPMNSWWNHQGF